VYEAEEFPLLEAVAKELLVNTTGWKRLNGCCELGSLAVAL
jgi:hypothetical protein